MLSEITQFPMWRFWQNKNRNDFSARFIFDALEWGLWDLPDIDSIVDLELSLADGMNIYHHIPKARSINTYRLVLTPANMVTILIVNIAAFPKNFFSKDKPWHSYNGVCFNEIERCYNELCNKIKYNQYKFISNRWYLQFKYGLQKEELETLYSFIPNNSKSLIILGDSVNYIYKNDQEINYSFIENAASEIQVARNINKYIFSDSGEKQCDYIVVNSSPFNLQVVKRNAQRPKITAVSLLEADYLRMQLPKLQESCLSDKEQGLWDAWWPEGANPNKPWYASALLNTPCVAANPWEDIQQGSAVCIDFGTSSTVAAVRESDGSIRLLRIGGRLDDTDRENDDAPDFYENPTALEFANYKESLTPWQNEPWRPMVQWKDVKCSHLACNEIKQGLRAQSGIRNIKTWSRALPGTFPLRLKDEQGEDFELTPLSVDNITSLGDFHKRPLDPIELYAYFLGLACNNQSLFGGRIYCDYAMTFPVKFPQEVRQRILQGFYRGLLRSMPCSLSCSPHWKEKPLFRLRERASEPTAFAASVLPYLGIEPTEEGVPFGVFDFGGGTTDFAFGIYRLPDPIERGDNGWEKVLEILDVSGDENLGGEYLLELLMYDLLRDVENARQCIECKVAFTLPHGKSPFDGSELLFTTNTREARTNMVTLCEHLRPLWEKGKFPDDDTGRLELSLLDRDGKETRISFIVDEEKLRGSLRERINQGVNAFFVAFSQAFKINSIRPQVLHVLLAGNSCRSSLVREVFEAKCREVVPEEPDTILVHYEMLPGGHMDAAEAMRRGTAEVAFDGGIPPTLKTGVALGLLRLLPGEATGVVELNRKAESPFLFTVGFFEQDILVPIVQRNAEYGQWHHVGKVFREGVSVLGYSASPLAMEKRLPRAQCHPLRFEWGEENFGKSIFIKASGPREIIVALGKEGAEQPDDSFVQKRTLKS